MRRLFQTLICLYPLLAMATTAPAQRFAGDIRLNQLGFYPGASKIAAIAADVSGPFYITTPDLVDTVFVGTISGPYGFARSRDVVRVADFSTLSTAGTYRVWIPSLGYSHPFEIRPRIHEELARSALKAFYFNRASQALPASRAGVWSRPAGHPDDSVRVHPSAATAQRPEGTVLSSPGGWYDAGDYNKYIVNSGITVATLLSLYEDFPHYASTLDTEIPETGNALPDLLDETLWNLRWMLTMQDPNDGGVYHKLTEAQFSDLASMPAEVRARRWVVQKSTAATLDFAAVMAQASRVLRRFEGAVPGLADSTLAAARQAWQWARLNPNVVYDQEAMNRQFDPDVTTGAYGDTHLRDELIWAASELYATTREDSFFTALPQLHDGRVPVPDWGEVRTLGYYSLLRHGNELRWTAAQRRELEQLVVAAADSVARGMSIREYLTPMGVGRDFVWGSNAVAANQGIMLIQAYRLTGDASYLRSALANLDYVLGRNATGYSYVTGFGDRTPVNPHHRIAVADGVQAPVPGWLVGGPNPGRQDRCNYPSAVPDRAYVDDECSYASNEIAINWNAPLVYLTAAIEALQYEIGRDPASPGSLR